MAMKVLMLNGSANANGTTFTALTEIGKTLEQEGIGYEIFNMGGAPVRDCIGCGQCSEQGCTFTDDGVNEFVSKAKEADGFIFGTPVYYAHPSGRVLSFLDRVFYSSGRSFAYKPGASVAEVAARWKSSTNISGFHRCRWWVPPIGIWCMEERAARRCSILRGCRQCAI